LKSNTVTYPQSFLKNIFICNFGATTLYQTTGTELVLTGLPRRVAPYLNIYHLGHNHRMSPLYSPWGHGIIGAKKTPPLSFYLFISVSPIAACWPRLKILGSLSIFTCMYCLPAEKVEIRIHMNYHVMIS
jgi:hypothetical protein